MLYQCETLLSTTIGCLCLSYECCARQGRDDKLSLMTEQPLCTSNNKTASRLMHAGPLAKQPFRVWQGVVEKEDCDLVKKSQPRRTPVLASLMTHLRQVSVQPHRSSVIDHQRSAASHRQRHYCLDHCSCGSTRCPACKLPREDFPENAGCECLERSQSCCCSQAHLHPADKPL